MILIILVAICGFVCMVSASKGDSDEIAFGFGFATLISLVLLIGMAATGVDVYPSLRASEKKVLSLKSEIESIRSAYYSQVKAGSFVGGSLDNMTQSSRLSEYISNYAEEKSGYNAKLTYYKEVKELKMYRLFAYGMFIDSRIEKLQPIE